MYLALALVCLTAVCGTEGAWQLVWSDEFNGDTLKQGEWAFETGGSGWGNNELEFYTANRAQNARVENGHLVIHAKVEEHEGKHFTSARLHSKKAWAYGKFEARAKLPKGKHLWPAIWLFPQNSVYGQWAASGEIDIMEYRGEQDSVILGTIHYGGTQPNNIMSGSGEKNMGKDLSADWHTYGLEWDKNSIRWYFDGKEFHNENINRNMWSHKGNNPYNHNGAPFDQPFHWILNLAVGGSFFPGNPNVTPAEARNWPKATMEIDYVRVYENK